VQIVGLMCAHQERHGRYSQYASGLAIHNELLAARPDLMPILYTSAAAKRRGAVVTSNVWHITPTVLWPKTLSGIHLFGDMKL
jgi:hypothetical protein